MDSADPKSNRGWRTRLTFQERATRADRGSVAVRETRETGGRSTGGLAAEARAAVEHAIAKGFSTPSGAESVRRRVVIAFRPPASGSKTPEMWPTPDRARPTKRRGFFHCSSLVRWQNIQREKSPRLRLETRGRSRSPSDAMSADPNALLAFKQLNLKERVRVHVGFRSRRARSPAKNAKCFFPPPAPSSCDPCADRRRASADGHSPPDHPPRSRP